MEDFSKMRDGLMLDENFPTEGLDDFCSNEEEEERNVSDVNEEEEQYFFIEGTTQIGDIEFVSLSGDDFRKFEFASLDLAFAFYNCYAKMRGFGGRRGQVVRNKKYEVVQQTFLCYRQGLRDEKYVNMENRKREARPETRCGCEAKVKVHIVKETGRWQFTYFEDNHNHELLADKYIGMLASHRKMCETDIMEMNNFRNVGIGTSQIYGSFASQAGGPDKMNFGLRNMYNQIERQRRMESTDSNAAISYLGQLQCSDTNLFWKHTVDNEGRLEHLFWCDGVSQNDFEIFRVVLAFDATYKKNKYMCPLVVFSGVNHHNETVIFGAALVANETEETYVWVLEQLTTAMKGKRPISIITDSDLAMRNAIRKVFPNAWHRLCAWHLLRNATTNVAIPMFTKGIQDLMFGDLDVSQFRWKWNEIIVEFGLEGNNWVQELYEKRKMWSAAHIRGRFFAGFRTTSRCESFHAQLGKFVHSKNNLTEFLHHFNRCLDVVRFNEQYSDFQSSHGVPVMKSDLRALEKSASIVYTNEIFKHFRPILGKAARVNVVSVKESGSCCIYTVKKFCTPGREWNVSMSYAKEVFKCSCLLMESKGIPCEHIVGVLVYLDIDKLPNSLVLTRWTKTAKESIVTSKKSMTPNIPNALYMNRYVSAVHFCREMCKLYCMTDEGYHELREKVANEIEEQRQNQIAASMSYNGQNQEGSVSLKNPIKVRSKGCGRSSSSAGGRGRRVIRCGLCKAIGHNRKSCRSRADVSNDEAEEQLGESEG